MRKAMRWGRGDFVLGLGSCLLLFLFFSSLSFSLRKQPGYWLSSSPSGSSLSLVLSFGFFFLLEYNVWSFFIFPPLAGNNSCT